MKKIYDIKPVDYIEEYDFVEVKDITDEKEIEQAIIDKQEKNRMVDLKTNEETNLRTNN